MADTFNESLSSLFETRKASFFASFERILNAMGNDDYIRQMFHNQLSETYVPDRICELVKGILTDEREKYISSLVAQINALELCFGVDHCKSLQKIGQELAQKGDDPEAKKLLLGQVARIAHKLMKGFLRQRQLPWQPDPAEIKPLKAQINAEIKASRDLIAEFKSDVVRTLQEAKTKLSVGVMESRMKLERHLTEKQLELEKLSDNCNRNGQDISQLQQQKAELEIALEKTTKKARRRRDKALKIVSQLSEELENTGNELAVAKAHIQQLVEDNELLRTAVKRLADTSQEAQLNESLQEISMLRSENESLHALETSISELQEQNAELNRQLEEQSARMKDIDDQNMVIRARCERLQADHNDLGRLRDENRSLKEQMKKTAVESKDAQIKTLKEENQRLLARLSETDQKLKKKIEISKEQEASVAVLTEQNELLVTALKDVKREYKVQKKLNVDYVQQMMELKSSMSSLTLSESIPGTPIRRPTEDEKRISELEAELNESKAAVAKLTAQVQNSTSDNERLEQRLSSYNSELVRTKQGTEIKVAQIIAQAKALFDISSLDDVPRVLNEVKQQITQANSMLLRIKNTCQVKEGGDLVSEVRRIKQEWTLYSQYIQEISSVLGITSVERLSRGVTDLKAQAAELRERENRIFELLNIKNSSQLIKQITRLTKSAKCMGDVCAKLKVSEEGQAVQTVAELSEIRACLKESVGNDDILSVRKFIEKSIQAREREKRIMEILNLFSEKNIEPAIQNLLRKGDEYRDVQGSLRLTSDSERVNQLNIADQCCREACHLLELSRYEEIPSTINELLEVNAQMNDLEEKVMSVLGIMSPESIVPRVLELRNVMTGQSEIVNKMCKILKVHDESDIIDRLHVISRDIQDTLSLKETLETDDVFDAVKELQTNNRRKQRLLSEIREKLSADNDDQIIPAISVLQKDRTVMQGLNKMCPREFGRGEIQQNFSQILEQLSMYEKLVADISELLNCSKTEDVKRAVVKMNRQLSLASELFTDLMTFITASKMTVNFPIDEALAQRLSGLIDDYKRKLQSERAQIDTLMHKAFSFGYHGSNITEAVDTIVSACSEYERSDVAGRMHKDLMDVRSTNERQQQHSQKQIDKLKASLDEFREQAGNRETQLLKQLEDEKSKVVELQTDLSNEQRVHEELMQLICGQAHDSDFLKETLGTNDARIVQQAEDTLAFIQEVNKRKVESEQIITHQRQERQSLFKSRH